MSDKWIIIGTGVAVAALVAILNSCQQADMHREFDRVQGQLDRIEVNIVDLRERVTRIETLLDYTPPVLPGRLPNNRLTADPDAYSGGATSC